MKRTAWQQIIGAAHPGLSIAALARAVNQPYGNVRYWAPKLGYVTADGRDHPHPDKFKNIRRVNTSNFDWTQSNPELAKLHGISRQRVWQLRKNISATALDSPAPTSTP